MGADEGLEFAEQLIFEATHEHLSDLRREIFKGAWAGRTYEDIAVTLGYNDSYIKEEGSKLCKLLTSVLGEPVTKTIFRAALERRYRLSRPDPVQNNGQTIAPVIPAIGEPPGLDPNFVGRESAIADLQRLTQQGARMILIQGEGGQGKTTLARKFFDTQGFDDYLELWMGTETQNLVSVETVVEEWLRRDYNEEPGREFRINLERLKRKLRDDDRRIGVLIDNLEPALNRDGKVIESRRSYVDLLRTLADPTVHSVTLITSRERLFESSVGAELYILQGLDEQAWRQFFRSRNLNPDSTAIGEMCRAYGGNPKAMKILSGVILNDFDGDLDAYWQENKGDLLIERELQDLVASQFDRLRSIYPEAYRLLCRLGCYRYQDVPHVSSQGLYCLLWDVPEAQRKAITRTLQNRSLVEARKSKDKYWLHPVIQAEAIIRLRTSGEWELAHRKAAEHWLSSVETFETVDDGLRALEAYQHYLEIGDLERACDLLAEDRTPRKEVPLGWFFYRLGLLEQVVSAITAILDKLRPDYRLGRLYNLLGYIYRFKGQIQAAQECHREATRIAETLNLDGVKISALFNTGLCKRDLAEYADAATLFEQVYGLSSHSTQFYDYAVYSLCCLAYLKTYLGLETEARQLAQQVEQQIYSAQLTSWGRGYSLLFLGSTYRNLGDLERAWQLYQQTIHLSGENYFTQIRAKAIHGIAQLYREQQDLAEAIAYHQAAIELLDKIGAKCDLADAQYHLGLTYQRLGNAEQSQSCFRESLQLFNEMHIPLRIEQVRQAMD
jgi:tetratricopeptide (TPR) repeat protein